MKIVIVHNYYLQSGGEDVVVEQERALLANHGHSVVFYSRSNDEFLDNSLLQKARGAAETVWSSRTYREFADVLAHEKPDVVHVHNTFAAISPSLYWACRSANVPVVQTLHNFRLFCPAATFYRDSGTCTDCLGKSLVPSLLHRCYHDSLLHTGVLAGMLTTHRALGTYNKLVNRYIALTEFAREKFIDGGLSPHKIITKPNFLVTDPRPASQVGEGAVFVGRLTQDKGCRTLVHAWREVDPSIHLQIVGDGPLRAEMENYVREHRLENVKFCGLLPRAEVLQRMKRSAVLIFPSEWFELFPMTLVEAFACGLPVIASDSPGIASIVRDGVVGRLFRTGDAQSLAQVVHRTVRDRVSLSRMAFDARAEFEAKYTASRNYPLLLDIYAQAMGTHRVEEMPLTRASA